MSRKHLLMIFLGVLVALAAVGPARARDAAPAPDPATAPGLALPAVAPAATAPGEAAGKDWSLDLDMTWNSKYVWRGIVVTEDPVLQPSINFTYKDLTLNVWANIDTTDVNDYGWQSNEVDFTLDYAFSWKCLNFSVGAVHYMFPQAHVIDTTEVYAGIGVDCLASPKLTVYQDLDESEGTYLLLSFGHSFENVWQPCQGVSMGVDLSASFGWGSRRNNAFYYGSSGSGWADATVGVGLPLAIGDHVTLTPAAHYMWVLDDGVTSSLGRDSAFWAGISLTVSF